MSMETGLEFRSGAYRCHDIYSLQIRVFLKSIKSTSESGNYDAREELVLNWQDRVFCPWEIKYYSDIYNCESKLQKEYYSAVSVKASDENFGKNMLFSYTSMDSETESMKNYCYGYKKYCYQNNTIRIKLFSQQEMNSVVHKNNQDISGTVSLRNSAKEEYMYIMADVEYLTDGEVNEQVLVTIKWEPSTKELTVFPDFNDKMSGPGYTLNELSNAHGQFMFWVTYLKPQDNDPFLDRRENFIGNHKFPLLHLIYPRRKFLDISLSEMKSLQCFINFYFVSNDLKLFLQLLLDVVPENNHGRTRKGGCIWFRLKTTPGHSFITYSWWPDIVSLHKNLVKKFFIRVVSQAVGKSYFGCSISFNEKELSRRGFGIVTS